MKINLLAAGAFAAALAMPLGVYAQQGPPPTAQSVHRTPSAGALQHRWMRRLSRLNLSGDQQQRIQSIINQYAQSHPEGSPVDRNARRAMRMQLMGVLNGDQQNQLREQMRARRAQMQQRRAQYQGQQQYQQGPPNQQYQQGPPNQQYQQDPRQYQQPPPDQQYQQGPPSQQYQQDPRQYQQPPPDQQYQQGPPDQQEPQPDQQPGPPPPRS